MRTACNNVAQVKDRARKALSFVVKEDQEKRAFQSMNPKGKVTQRRESAMPVKGGTSRLVLPRIKAAIEATIVAVWKELPVKRKNPKQKISERATKNIFEDEGIICSPFDRGSTSIQSIPTPISLGR